MSTPADHRPLKIPPKVPTIPRPSSSVLLISPSNQILLLHRVRTSSSFASAHVFPGGALSAEHDGPVPHVNDPLRHRDGPAYRMAAIRETFEECGILLVKSKKTGRLVSSDEIGDEEREEGRKAVHAGKVKFGELLDKWRVEPDTEALIPFTRWVTPHNVPKRFSTQMYLYFLPIGSTSPTKHAKKLQDEEEDEIIIPNPTHDGGLEHTAAKFLPPNKWLDLARQNRILLYPPQYLLMWLLSPHLSPTVTSSSSPIPSVSALHLERNRLLEFLSQPRFYNSAPEVSFADACISPVAMGKGMYGEDKQDGVGKAIPKDTAVLQLDKPGREIEEQGSGRRGLMEWVVTTRFKKEGPRDVEVRRRAEIVGEAREKL